MVHNLGARQPEFIATHLQDWLKKVGIKPMQIYPGSPWENGYNERFNGTLRKEVLNAEWFHTTRQAQVAINVWLRQYNQIRPHHALNMRPPVPETLLEKPKIKGEYRGLDRKTRFFHCLKLLALSSLNIKSILVMSLSMIPQPSL